MAAKIVDYDAFGYDYRTYWGDRDYELWAEDRALSRLVPHLGRPEWFVDLGGGFGRNAAHYRTTAGHYVIADYSATNLSNAAQMLADDIAGGRAFLVRCDVNALPFADAAFDAGMVVRVLHHLGEVDRALEEMGRVIAGPWLVDVPIKHHVLGVLRGIARGRWREVRGPEPTASGSAEEPIWSFRLSAIRQRLERCGWHTRVLASVNNLRRWDAGLPQALARAIRPLVNLIELGAQQVGRGWWGPSQFLLARRAVSASKTPLGKRPSESGEAPGHAALMVCPACRGALSWTSDSATCVTCVGRYPKVGAYWDFTTIFGSSDGP